jgi:hypothetical protein
MTRGKSNGFMAAGSSMVASFALLGLTGCAEKPPACADPQTIAVAGQIVQGEVRDRFTPQFTQQPEETRQELSRLLQDYVARLKVGLVNIVSNGYNSEAKRFSCEGKLTVTSATGREISLQTPYTTQKTQDQKATFLLRIDRFDTLERDIASDFLAFVDAEIAKRAAMQPAAAPASQPGPRDALEESYAKDNASAQLSRAGELMPFELHSAVDSFTCELSGTAKLETVNLATFTGTDKDDPCSARFEFASDQVTVSTEGCSSACGMRGHGSMDGIYKRLTQRRKEP